MDILDSTEILETYAQRSRARGDGYVCRQRSRGWVTRVADEWPRNAKILALRRRWEIETTSLRLANGQNYVSSMI